MNASNKIINLNPIFLDNTNRDDLINFNSVFLYIFLLFELIIIILLIYFFFKLEIKYIYNSIFHINDYSIEDKKKYNDFMNKIKNIVNSEKYCKKIAGPISINNKNKKNNQTIENKYFALYDNNKHMLCLNKDKIYFDTEEECLDFLIKD